MRNVYLRLYVRYVAASVRAQLQYRASFFMMTLGQFLAIAIEFAGIQALFDRFGTMRGWSLPEVALLYGMANTAFALADMFGRGFDQFGTMVRSGDFDRLLLRPLPTAFQLLAQDLVLMRLGRILCGLLALSWAMGQLAITTDAAKIVLLLFSLLGGACVFFGLFVLQAASCFRTIETLEIWSTVTYGGVEAAQFPMPLYRSWMRDLFTFIVPLACLNYLPASVLLNRSADLGVPPILAWTCPIIGFVFLAISLRVWSFGERHYLSTGS
ncbi:MAG: ABC-2 family transporter protein [Capsulimonadales bacterium]|nr:ABC-2 family transporter protein [Capsulimonadales bacterium]